MPPAALTCSTASSAPILADFPSAAAKPVSGTLNPTLIVSAWPDSDTAKAATPKAVAIKYFENLYISSSLLTYFYVFRFYTIAFGIAIQSD